MELKKLPAGRNDKSMRLKRTLVVMGVLLLLLAAFAGACGSASRKEIAVRPSSSAVPGASGNAAGLAESTVPGLSAGAESGNVLIVYFSHEGNNASGGIATNTDAVTSASVQREGNNFPSQRYHGVHMGNTQIIANYIAEHTGAALFAIQTVNSYPLDAYETLDAAQTEFSQNARPELSVHVEDMDAYDTIYLGYPIWYGTMPMPVFTFLETYDFTGKTIIPFSTHDGSGLGSAVWNLKSLCPNSIILDGIAIRYSDVPNALNTVTKWIDDLHVQ